MISSSTSSHVLSTHVPYVLGQSLLYTNNAALARTSLQHQKHHRQSIRKGRHCLDRGHSIAATAPSRCLDRGDSAAATAPSRCLDRGHSVAATAPSRCLDRGHLAAATAPSRCLDRGHSAAATAPSRCLDRGHSIAATAPSRCLDRGQQQLVCSTLPLPGGIAATAPSSFLRSHDNYSLAEWLDGMAADGFSELVASGNFLVASTPGRPARTPRRRGSTMGEGHLSPIWGM